MPTTRRRCVLTESDDLAAALDDAAARRPEDAGSRARLLVPLVEEGHRAVFGAQQEALEERRRAVRRTAGALTGAYESDDLERLRDDRRA